MREKRVGAGVGVMIIRGGTVLLGKRHHDPEKADSDLHGEGTWTMPGGSIEFGEELEEAAMREVEEETGIVLDPKKLNVTNVSNDKVADAHFVTIGLLYEANDIPDPKVREPDEIVEWRWFPVNKLPQPLFFPSKRIAKNYMDNVFYQKHVVRT